MQEILKVAKRAALAGGQVLARFRTQGCKLNTREKLDSSILTDADGAASIALRAVILAHDPDAFILDEELEASHKLVRPDHLWIVDPLDGTRAYAQGLGGYASMVSYVVDNIPRVGVIYFPQSQMLVFGGEDLGACMESPSMRETHWFTGWQPERLSGTRLFVPNKPAAQDLYNGLCMHLNVKGFAGQNISAVMYLAMLRNACETIVTRCGKPALWDIAAGHALVRAIGGDVVDLWGRPMDYSTDTQLTNGSISVINPCLLPQILDQLPPREQIHY